MWSHRSGIVLSMMGLLSIAAPTAAIIQGQSDGSAHPYVGAVDIRAAGLPIVASGVLISPTVLLTARHVTRFFDRAGLTRARVTFDPVVSESATWHWGTVHTNPAFTSTEPQDNQNQDPSDLGVIVFDEPIAGITPASLPTEDFLEQFRGQDHQSVVFDKVGYGTSAHVGDANNHGLGAFAGDGTRKVLHAQFAAVQNGWLKLDTLDGEVCYGDSGGPVLLGNLAVSVLVRNANLEWCTGTIFEMRLDSAAHRAFLGQYVTLP